MCAVWRSAYVRYLCYLDEIVLGLPLRQLSSRGGNCYLVKLPPQLITQAIAMALVDIWKRSQEELRGKSIQQILLFSGDGKLRDGSTTSTDLRDFLSHVPSELLAEYAIQCLELKNFTDSGLVLQDIVNQIGRRLGFQIQHGRYRGVVNAIGFDGIWQTKQSSPKRKISRDKNSEELI